MSHRGSSISSHRSSYRDSHSGNLNGLLVDVGLGRDLLMHIRLSRDLGINIGLGRDLLMHVGLSLNLNVNIGLSGDLLVDIRLSNRVDVGIGYAGVIGSSGIKSMDGSSSISHRGSSGISDRGSGSHSYRGSSGNRGSRSVTIVIGVGVPSSQGVGSHSTSSHGVGWLTRDSSHKGKD